MDKNTLDLIGLSQEELQQKVVNQLADRLLETDGGYESEIQKRIQKHIDSVLDKLFQKHVAPKAKEMIEGLTLQQTNAWGEARGEEVSFIEYLTQRADAYMREEVNYEGKSRSEANGYSWNKTTTRVAFMVDRYLQYSIQQAMEKALKNANSSIVQGLEEAVKVSLNQVLVGLECTVKAKGK